MGWRNTYDSKFDPSGIKQDFATLNLKVHCCRYWKLTEWDYTNLSFPFWRLYYNTVEGASIHFKKQILELRPSTVVLIPPYTSFSTALRQSKNERLSGNRIESVEELKMLKQLGMIDHFFIHFNLGFQYDHIEPGFYSFHVDNELYDELKIIRYAIIRSFEKIDYQQSMQIYALILKLLSKIDKESWIGKNHDVRVVKVIAYIDSNYATNLSNDYLAGMVAMAPNSFLRLFKMAIGLTLQRYIQKVRIEKALLEMHNSTRSIEQIAQHCGYPDRHHFSKVFKQVVGLPPGKFRQQKTYS